MGSDEEEKVPESFMRSKPPLLDSDAGSNSNWQADGYLTSHSTNKNQRRKRGTTQRLTKYISQDESDTRTNFSLN